MRQTGFLAGCVAYALTHNFPQLPRVHALAKKLEAGLEDIGAVIMSRAETCMVRLPSLTMHAILTVLGVLRSYTYRTQLRRDC
jgi:threonine aldolase